MPLNRTQNKLLLDNCSPQSAVFTWGGSNLLFDEASEAFLHGQDELSGGSTTQQYHLLCYFRHNTLLKPKGLPRKRQLIQWKVSVELRYYSFSICILLWLSGPIHSPELKIRDNSDELWEDGDLWKGDNIRAGISIKTKLPEKLETVHFLWKASEQTWKFSRIIAPALAQDSKLNRELPENKLLPVIHSHYLGPQAWARKTSFITSA